MASIHPEKLYRKELSDRLKVARERKRMSQADMGKALRITKERYQKMEQRGALPPYLFEPFALIVEEDALYILTGRREKEPARRVA